MIHGLGNQFRAGPRGSVRGTGAVAACQDVSRADAMAAAGTECRRPALRGALRAAGGAVASLVYTALDRLAQLALNAHFRRVRVLHRERFPRSGAVLLVANHPSAWADAVLLLGAFGRKLHFLVEGNQFHPWTRALLLRLFGALPVHAHGSDPAAPAKNAETFRRCEALLDRGEVVAVFPEGVSATDRTVMPLRLGAARLALSYAGKGRPLALVAVGLHYSDRVAFRSDVAINVGEPVRTPDLASLPGDLEEAASVLTTRIAWRIRSLALGAVRPRQAAVLAALEPVAARLAEARNVDVPAEVLARSLEDLEREDPVTFCLLGRRALAQDRIRRALRVSGRALVAPRPRRRSPRAIAGGILTALGALPAAVGALIHAIPAGLTNVATRRLAETPAQVAFVRIAAGSIFFLSAYAMAAAALLLGLGAGIDITAGMLLLGAVLGACALAYTPHAREWSDRWRLGWISLRHLDLVCRAHREEEWLVRRVEALLEYGLEVADVHPAYPPVLDLGPRPSPLPR